MRLLFKELPKIAFPQAPEEKFNQIRALEAKEQTVSVPSLDNLLCHKCKLSFKSVEEQRIHFRSEFHLTNQSRISAGKKALNEEVFQMITHSGDTDPKIWSESGSDDDDSEVEEKEIQEELYKFQTPKVGTEVSCLCPSILKASTTKKKHKQRQRQSLCLTNCCHSMLLHRVLLTPADVRWGLLSAKEKQGLFEKFVDEKDALMCVLMFRSGHFAGSVFNKTGDVLHHKTFHRYTCRKKQGGAQSKKDSSGSKPKSYGAFLRRRNEQVLQDEIAELLCSWSEPLDKCSHVFISCSKSNLGVFFNPETSSVITKSDERIRPVPFMTRSPTLMEVKRTFESLITVNFECTHLSSSSSSAAADTKDDLNKASSPSTSSLSSSSPPPPSTSAAAFAFSSPKRPVLPPNTSTNTPSPTKSTVPWSFLSPSPSGRLSPGTSNSPTSNSRSTSPIQMTTSSKKKRKNSTSSVPDDPFQPLFDAVKAGDQKQWKEVVESGIHNNAQDLRGNTSLHWACRYNMPAMIAYLLEEGVSPLMRNGIGELAFSLCRTKLSEDAFRSYFWEHPNHDLMLASGVDRTLDPLETEMKMKRKREKKRQQRQRKKLRKQKELEMSLNEEMTKNDDDEIDSAMKEFNINNTIREPVESIEKSSLEDNSAAQMRIDNVCARLGLGIEDLIIKCAGQDVMEFVEMVEMAMIAGASASDILENMM
eukprot:TRINITY_DN19972_c0_g2_i1.p1 TRINITY_DN19972_c0_g2~~TRINITY_DN19972_c0_g2_i1.p1  ORF type:complete len:721 (-),score=180.11 TRINITY_DN19972_c0_g2_i1:178-2286(-)